MLPTAATISRDARGYFLWRGGKHFMASPQPMPAPGSRRNGGRAITSRLAHVEVSGEGGHRATKTGSRVTGVRSLARSRGSLRRRIRRAIIAST